MSAAAPGMSLARLLRWRLRASWNAIRQLRQHSRLKIAIISVAAVLIWLGILFATWEGLRFMDRRDFSGAVKAVVVDFVLSSFFLALLILLSFSNGVIVYGSLFRGREAAFLMSCPLRPAAVFSYCACEGLVFSSWAFLFLGLPMVIGLGLNLAAPWTYYPLALAFFAAFALIPASLGAMGAILVARRVAQSPRRLAALLALLAAVLVASWAVGLAGSARFSAARGVEAWVSDVLGKLSFAQNPLLPSFWASTGLLALTRGDWPLAMFRLELLAANGLMLTMMAWAWASRAAAPAFHLCQGQTRRRHAYADSWVDRLLSLLLAPVPKPVRLLVVKDAKTFRRDVAQWSQVSIFFGLLAIYILNVRRFRYHVMSEEWRNMVSFLNLGATTLTLSTFTTRFIFPLLSLEGRCFWTLGLLPIERRSILSGKFLFSFCGSLIISEGLMLLSDIMLRAPLPMIVLHAYIVLVVCAGLSGLAVGLGALYPNMAEENPSKIVSGFGGSLNLMLSMLYLTLVIALFAVPFHLAFLGGQPARWLKPWLAVATLLAGVVGALVTWLPLRLGARAFEKMEA